MFRSDIQDLHSNAQAAEIIASVNAISNSVVLSTSFGHYSAVLLKLVTDVAPRTPVLWVDTGYNTEQTYRYCELLKDRLNLNLHIYHPQRSVTHRSALGGKVEPNDDGFQEFVDEIKLEPFRRALSHFEPEYWLSGIRGEETEHRRSLGILSEGPNGIKKVAPLYYWAEKDLTNFMIEHDLPFEENYVDPTKLSAKNECGLHCRL